VPKNGISRAKKIKGISINDLLATVISGSWAIFITVKIMKKYAIKAVQLDISVETAIIMKSRPATIFICEGIS